MAEEQKSISDLIGAADFYRRLSRGASVDFALGLLLLLKRFYDQKEIIPGLKTPKEFINAFDEFKELYVRSPEISLDKLCRIIDGHEIMPLSLSMKMVELERSKELDHSVLTRFLEVLFSCELTSANLRAAGTSFESLFNSLCNIQGSSRYRTATGLLGKHELRYDVVRTMMHFLRAELGHSVYCPYDHSIAITKHLRVRLEADGHFDLNKDLKITVQAINSYQMDMHQLVLLTNDVANVEFYNSDPLSRPLLEPRERIKLSNITTEELLEDLKKDRLRQFDRAIALAPIGITLNKEMVPNDRFNRFKYGKPKTKVADYYIIQHILSSVNNEGIAVILSSRGPLLREQELEIRKAIIDEDVLEAVVQLPSDSCGSTSTPLVMLVFNKAKDKSKENKVIYIDAQRILGDGVAVKQSAEVINLFRSFKDREHICKIVSKSEIEANNYNLSPQLYVDDSDAANQLRGLLAQHSNYKLTSFSENGLVLDLKKLRKEEDINDGGNCIYMPSISNMQPITNIRERLANTKTPIDRYYQVHLNPKLVIAEYAEFFFKTELGKTIFGNLGEGETIPHVNLSLLMRCRLATPPIKVQRDILETFRKFESLDTLVEDYKRSVVLNPESALTMSDKLDDMIASVTKLSEEEVVLGLIRGGESRHLEFKETFEFNKHVNGNRDPRLVDACIKTIGAFLNTGGGDLLVGVADDQQVIGIERDIKMNKGSHDSFLLHFKNFIEKRIGQEYYPVIDQRVVMVKGKPVLRVRCNSVKEAGLRVVFVDNEDCFVRTNPATDKLTGRELESFLRSFSEDKL